MRINVKSPPLIILSFLAIVGSVFIPVYTGLQNGAFVIASLFPLAAAWLMGLRNGLLYWFLHSILLFFLAPVAGSSLEDLKSSGIPMYAVTFLLTAGIGKIKDLYKRLLDELGKRKKIEKELNEYKQQLEKLVETRTAELVRVNEQLRQEIIQNEKASREKLNLEASLKRAEKLEALGILAGGVAHDLNNILGGILSYPDLLLLDIPEDNPLREPILTIKKCGERAAAVVQDLLTLARRGILNPKVTNLNHIINDFFSSPEYFDLKNRYPGIDVEIALEQDLISIQGSPVHLSKAIMNLIANAMEAMGKGGRVTVSTANIYVDTPENRYEVLAEGEYATVEISDTGDGIPQEDLGSIFEPFYTKKIMGKSGTGLGLAIVWGTVKDHKGYVDVQSTVDKGTRFSLYFPTTRQTGPSRENLTGGEAYGGNGESVLVIDDVDIQRTLATSILMKLGYDAKSVSGGREAIEYLQSHSVDLLVLDMIMKDGLNGFETYKRIVEIHPRQKCIIVSGYAATAFVKQAQELGAGAYVKKPYTLEKLGKAVKNELQKERPLVN